ncbi:hypothetical protein HMPREF0577_0571 [Mobiluncus mulieris ATCC 35243]|nr:hypothetical protein HMPREF0577_0571 [Mobiluncus mulieris ATCC 35243]
MVAGRRMPSVFPAPAGVIPVGFVCLTVVLSFPRASGGNSIDHKQLERTKQFSPRQRG